MEESPPVFNQDEIPEQE